MKFHRDPRFSRSLYTALSLCIAIVFYFFFRNIGDIMAMLSQLFSLVSPFLTGFALAYLFIRPLRWVEGRLSRLLFKGNPSKPGLLRTLSILVVLTMAWIFLGLVGSFVTPQLMESLNTLNRNFPSYITGLQNLANSALASLGVKGDLYQMVSPYWNQIFEYLKNFFAQLVPWLLNFSANLVSQVMNLLVTFVTCIYFLFNKELFARQLKKLCYAIFPVRFNESLLETVQIVDETFGGYINGQLVDAVVIGTLTTVSMMIFRLPYAVLVGVIVACTNVIPMVGPFIGAIPSFFIILMAGKPMQALGFVVLILVIQQIDGNILAPKIVGGSTNLSGFWVLFSIIVAGGLFGIGGIVLCVPTLSVFFKLLRRWTDSSLRSRGLPEPSQAYAKGQFPRPTAGLEDPSEKE